jgi:nucleoside-diphosphate-sugar epimerase
MVTGGAGFIGGAIVGALGERGDEVLALDLFESPRLAALRARHAGISFRPAEVTEWPHLAEAVRAFRPEAVVHCAAIVGVLNALASPVGALRVNVEGTLNLLSAMRLFEVKRLINLSSEEIYGPFREAVIDEGHPCFPVQTYGISKFAAEQLARDFAAENGMEAIHIRTCWVYGPDLPRPRVPKTLIDAAVDGQALHLASGADYVVDQVYIDDVVQGVTKALDHPRHAHDAYHISSGEAPPLGRIVEDIREIIPDADISIGPGTYVLANGMEAVKKGVLDHSRASRAFGYAPRFSLREGIAACIEARRRAQGRG